MHPMLQQASNPLRSPSARLGAYIAYEIDQWIAALHSGMRWCDLDDRPRKYLGGKSMQQHVLETIIDRSPFNRPRGT